MQQGVKLLPATKRLKQLVQGHGALWREIRREPVQCFENDMGVLVESLDGLERLWVLPCQVQEAEMIPGPASLLYRHW